MQIREFMREVGEVVQPDQLLGRAATVLADLDADAIPVVDRGILVGIIRMDDLARHAGVGGSDPAAARVRDVMDKNAASCFPDDDLDEVGRVMLTGHIDPMPVLDRNSVRVVGLLRLADVATGLVDAKFAAMDVAAARP